MDLGKMLAEAFDGHARVSHAAYPNEQEFDLTAAAEAFLAKVREAEAGPLMSSNEAEAEFHRRHEWAVSRP